MVIAEQVKKTVDEKDRDLMLDPAPCRCRLPGCPGYGYDDVPQSMGLDMGKCFVPQRERQDVRCRVAAAVPAVQGAHCAVTDKEHAQFGVRETDVPQQTRELCFDCSRCQLLFPLVVFYPDIHHVSFLPGNSRRDNRSCDGRSR